MDYIGICYLVAVLVLAFSAIYAFVMGWKLQRSFEDTDSYLTARNQVGPVRIAWSFYASAMGAWVISSPSNYASFAGLLGLCFYSVASGLPFLMIAFAGGAIQKQCPRVMSLTDFIGWRYGFLSKTLVLVLTLFNMSIALLAEFITMASIFQYYVGTDGWPIVLIVGLLSLAYTTYGGLLVSIYTDTLQGICSVFFFVILAIYLAVTFRPESLPVPMPCKPDTACVSGTPVCSEFLDAGMTCPVTGYSSIFTMPVSLFTSTVFSEAMWQRAWASADDRTLRLGSVIGCVCVIVMVWFAGFCGLLASWGNLISYDPASATNPNLYLFQVLQNGQMPTSPLVSNWIGVVCVVLAAVMNIGAVDSIQTGMASAVTTYMLPELRSWNLTKTRIVVVVLNLGLIGIAIWLSIDKVKIGVLELFLVANVLCTSAAIPVLIGLSETLRVYIGGGSFIFATIFAVFCTCVYGVDYYYKTYPEGFVDPYIPDRIYEAKSFSSAMFYTWIGNGYQWQFFLVPFCVSLGAFLPCIIVSLVWQRFCGTLPALPGLRAAVDSDYKVSDQIDSAKQPDQTASI